MGATTVGGSCPAVHAAKINETSRAVAISLDMLWVISFNILEPGIPHDAGVAFSARDPQPSEPPDALPDGPDGELPGRHRPSGGVIVDDGPPEPAPCPASPGVVAGVPVAAGELAPVGPPEGPVVLRALWQDGVACTLTVPEAAPEALSAWGGIGRGLGLGDPHVPEFIVEEEPASSAGCQWGVPVLRLRPR